MKWPAVGPFGRGLLRLVGGSVGGFHISFDAGVDVNGKVNAGSDIGTAHMNFA